MARTGGAGEARKTPLRNSIPSRLALCSFYVLVSAVGFDGNDSTLMEIKVQHDVRLRAAARAIYEACYPGDEWAPTGFEEAERCGTVHYRQAVGAALEARALLAAPVQPELF